MDLIYPSNDKFVKTKIKRYPISRKPENYLEKMKLLHRMVKYFKLNEWVYTTTDYSDSESECPECGHTKNCGHNKNCTIYLFLKEVKKLGL